MNVPISPKLKTFELVRVSREVYDELRRRQRAGQSLGGVIHEAVFGRPAKTGKHKP